MLMESANVRLGTRDHFVPWVSGKESLHCSLVHCMSTVLVRKAKLQLRQFVISIYITRLLHYMQCVSYSGLFSGV